MHGPIVDPALVSGFGNSRSGAASSAAAATSGAAAAAASSVAINANSATFGHYASSDLEQLAIKLPEETRTIGKIYPGAEVELKGAAGSAESAAGWKGIWNFIAVFSPTACVGMPIYCAVIPPSTVNSAPVTYFDSSDAR